MKTFILGFLLSCLVFQAICDCTVSNVGIDSTVAFPGTFEQLGQSWTASCSGDLDSITITINQCTGGDVSLRMRVYDDALWGSTGGDKIADEEINVANGFTGDKTFVFSDRPSISNGNDYSFRLSFGGSGALVFSAENYGDYPGGTIILDKPAEAAYAYAAEDLTFSILIETGTSVVTSYFTSYFTSFRTSFFTSHFTSYLSSLTSIPTSFFSSLPTSFFTSHFTSFPTSFTSFPTSYFSSLTSFSSGSSRSSRSSGSSGSSSDATTLSASVVATMLCALLF